MISVVVPAYNAEKLIGRMLDSLVRQDYPKRKYEIIVVDDGSTDNTVGVARKYKSVRVFARKHGGPAKQRNFGAKKARGDIIFFTDTDCIVPRNTLKRIESDFRNNKDIAGIGGAYKTLNKSSPVARFVGYEIAFRHSRAGKYTDFIGTYCAAYKRKVFLKFRGFDESFPMASGEDPELSFRISKEHRLLFDRDLFVFHPHPDTAGAYLRQQFWRGYWRPLIYKRHPEKILRDKYSGTELVLSAMFVGLFSLSLALGLLFSSFLFVAGAFLAMFYIVNIGMISFMARKERKMLFISLVLILLRSMAGATGFFAGYIRSSEHAP